MFFGIAQDGAWLMHSGSGVAYVAIAGGMKNTVTEQTDSGPAWLAILALKK